MIKPIGAGQLPVSCYNGREALLNRGGKKTHLTEYRHIEQRFFVSYINLLTDNARVELNILTLTGRGERFL